ncbi:MAG: ABC transporter ATP-binding protein [Acidobacteriota bacterium]
MGIVIKGENLSKWYGNVLGLSEISVEISSGIQGLLGPNGAGKSTFLKILTGQLKPNIGEITIFGEPVFNNHDIFHRIGYCPEFDAYYREITGWEFIRFKSALFGYNKKETGDRALKALEKVGLTDSKDRRISEYSLGMRQRLKFASSIINDSDLLILDEPLRGVDPLWRIKIIKMLREFEEEGRTIIVSSHILAEIEAMTNNVILIHQGKIFAHGDIQEIRDLIGSHPHKISVVCDDTRGLAKKMISGDLLRNIQFMDSDKKVIFETDKRDRFFDTLTATVSSSGINVSEITSPDDNLQSVFDYLIGR